MNAVFSCNYNPQ